MVILLHFVQKTRLYLVALDIFFLSMEFHPKKNIGRIGSR